MKFCFVLGLTILLVAYISSSSAAPVAGKDEDRDSRDSSEEDESESTDAVPNGKKTAVKKGGKNSDGSNKQNKKPKKPSGGKGPAKINTNNKKGPAFKQPSPGSAKRPQQGKRVQNPVPFGENKRRGEGLRDQLDDVYEALGELLLDPALSKAAIAKMLAQKGDRGY